MVHLTFSKGLIEPRKNENARKLGQASITLHAVGMEFVQGNLAGKFNTKATLRNRFLNLNIKQAEFNMLASGGLCPLPA